mmetsp:Transcript_13310/g.15255  ORF Transcript_13310/g.15255 Transcript_13310/m.15255 type:complete len:1785 (-) Transcript_13310:4-5358(-)
MKDRGPQQQQPSPMRRHRQSDTRRHGFAGSPEGMEMTNVPDTQTQQSHEPPSITTAPPKSSSPVGSDSTIDSTPPDTTAASAPLTAKEPSLPSRQTEDNATPTKPRKRRLFITPSSRETTKRSPQQPRAHDQYSTPSPQPKGSSSSSSSSVITPKSKPRTQQFKTPGSTSDSTTTLSSSRQRSDRSRGRRQPPALSGLSGFATTPRSSRRQRPPTSSGRKGRTGFNPLSRISDIFSPQSPSFSSRASPIPFEFGASDSSASDSSTSGSVMEPFTEQVSRLDELLTTPSQHLGDLAMTSTNDDGEDDDLDAEMEDLESSRRMLADELSRVDFSLLGYGYGSSDGDATTGIRGNNSITNKGKTTPSPFKQKDINNDDDDWQPLLTAEVKLPPNFSPIGQSDQDYSSQPESSPDSDRNNRSKETTAIISGEQDCIPLEIPPRDEKMVKKSIAKERQIQKKSPLFSSTTIINASMKKKYDSLNTPPRGYFNGKMATRRNKDKRSSRNIASVGDEVEEETLQSPAQKTIFGQLKIVETKKKGTEISGKKNYDKLQTPIRVKLDNTLATRSNQKNKNVSPEILSIANEVEDLKPKAQNVTSPGRLEIIERKEKKMPGRNDCTLLQTPSKRENRENLTSKDGGRRQENIVQAVDAVVKTNYQLKSEEEDFKHAAAAEGEKMEKLVTTGSRKQENKIQAVVSTKHHPDSSANLSVAGKIEEDPKLETQKSPLGRLRIIEKTEEDANIPYHSNANITNTSFGDTPLSSLVADSRSEESIGSPSAFQSFVSFAERISGREGGSGIEYTPEREVEHSTRVLERLNSIFTPPENRPRYSDQCVPAITPERRVLSLAEEDTVVGQNDEDDLFNTPPRDQDQPPPSSAVPNNSQPDSSILGLSPISQSSEQLQSSLHTQELAQLLEASPGNDCISESEEPDDRGSVSTPENMDAPRSSDGKQTKSRDPHIIVSILPDDSDDEIVFDSDSPHTIDSRENDYKQSLDNLKKDCDEFDQSKIPKSDDTDDNPGALSVKNYSSNTTLQSSRNCQKRNCRKIFLILAILVFVIGLGLVLGTIFLAPEEKTLASSPIPTLMPTKVIIPNFLVTPSPISTATLYPSKAHSSPSLHPTTNQEFPFNLISPTSLSDHPSYSPTGEELEILSPINTISFAIPYTIYIANGVLDFVPESEYIPELIMSMDALTADILSNISKKRKIRGGRRESTNVVLPTIISSVSDIACPNYVRNSFCEEIVSEISLVGAEDTWRAFKDTMELAIEIGRLQYHLQRVDPDSPVEVIDSVWTPPVSTPATPTVATPIDSSPSDMPSDLPSLSPSLIPTNLPPSMPASATHKSSPPSLSNTSSTTLSSSCSLHDFLIENSFDDGKTLNDTSSPQYMAFSWLLGNKYLMEYSNKRILQRYSLATFYYATNGYQWLNNNFWLSDRKECNWYGKTGSSRSCNMREEIVNLELDTNNIHGSLPAELGLLSSSIERITLRGGPDTYLVGTIPTELGYLTRLKVFFVRSNGLVGTIPSEIADWTRLEQLDVSNNKLSGPLPSRIPHELTVFEVSNNALTGSLSSELGNLKKCRKMFLENNSFVSSIPSEIGKLEKLEVLRGGGNAFFGLPTELGLLSSADTISFKDSNITGFIPTQLGMLRNLRFLEIQNNELSGNIPSELAGIVGLKSTLDLSNNKLSGSLPTELGMLVELRGLKLDHNFLFGTVPSEIYRLKSLTSIQIDSNDFSGDIPTSVCKTFNQTYPVFKADCIDFDDNCPCCTTCCVEDTCICRYLGTPKEFLCYQRRL